MADDRIVHDNDKYYPPKTFSEKAWLKNIDEYKAMYDRSIQDPEGFWGEVAEGFFWKEKWDKVWSYNYDRRDGEIAIKWFENGKTNITYNCIDRHLETKGDQRAIIWEGNEPTEDAVYTYNQVSENVNKFSNVLKGLGVKKGDRVSIYMPMVPELAFAMLACARIGAIHSIVFGGFSPRGPEGPHHRLDLHRAAHRERHLARQEAGGSQEERRRGHEPLRSGRPQGRALRRGEPGPRARDHHGRGPGRLVE